MKKGERSKKVLIEATIELIEKCGCPGKISMKDIASHAGVVTSNITYHFKTRAELLNAVADTLRKHGISMDTPLGAYLKKNTDLLGSREGQALFIANLFGFYRDFIRERPRRDILYENTFRILLQEKELRPDFHNTALYFLKDKLAFYEIYRTITGKDDLDAAGFWYSAIFDPLTSRYARGEGTDRLDGKHRFSKNYDTKYLCFCMEQLMDGLGLRKYATNRIENGKNN